MDGEPVTYKVGDKDLPGVRGESFLLTLTKPEPCDFLPGHGKLLMTVVESFEDVSDLGWWEKYDKDDWDAKRKMEVKEYFVHRKNGKMHWEMFNGTGFAYNEKTITHFADILPPVI